MSSPKDKRLIMLRRSLLKIKKHNKYADFLSKQLWGSELLYDDYYPSLIQECDIKLYSVSDDIPYVTRRDLYYRDQVSIDRVRNAREAEITKSYQIAIEKKKLEFERSRSCNKAKPEYVRDPNIDVYTAYIEQIRPVLIKNIFESIRQVKHICDVFASHYPELEVCKGTITVGMSTYGSYWLMASNGMIVSPIGVCYDDSIIRYNLNGGFSARRCSSCDIFYYRLYSEVCGICNPEKALYGKEND